MWFLLACSDLGKAGTDTGQIPAEPDDDPGSATTLGSTGSSEINGSADSDWWSIDVPEPSFLRVQVAQDSAVPVQVRVIDSEGDRVAERALVEGDLIAWIPTAGAWNLLVTRRDGVSVPEAGAPYTLTPSFDEPFPEPDDEGTDRAALHEQGIRLETEDDTDFVLVEPGTYAIGVSGALSDAFTAELSVSLLDGTLHAEGTWLDLALVEPAVLAVRALDGFYGGWNVLHVAEHTSE